MKEENKVFLKLFKVGIKEKYGLFDIKGNFIIEPKFDDVSNFHEGLARVWVEGKCGYINTKGEWVVEPKFDGVNIFCEGFAKVWADGKYGYINTKGEWVVEPKFDYAHDFCEGLARVKADGRIGYINTKGEWVVKPYSKKKDKKTPSVDILEEYKGLPIIEIKTKEIDIYGKKPKGLTEYPIVGVVFGEDDIRAFVTGNYEEFCRDADNIIERFKYPGREGEVSVEASTKITGYGKAEDVEEMGDVIGCALNLYYGYTSAIGAYYWPDWFAKNAIFVVNKVTFTVDENYRLEYIDLSPKQLKILKEVL